MGDMISQEEIDALLGGDSGGSIDGHDTSISDIPDISEYVNVPENADQDNASKAEDFEHIMTSEQKDILGEIGNINMGTAATTLFTLLNQKNFNQHAKSESKRLENIGGRLRPSVHRNQGRI